MSKQMKLMRNNLNVVYDQFNREVEASLNYMVDYTKKSPDLYLNSKPPRLLILSDMCKKLPKFINVLSNSSSSDNLVLICTWVNMDTAEELMVKFHDILTVVMSVDINTRKYERTRDGYRVNIIELYQPSIDTEQLKELFYKTYLYKNYIGNNINDWRDKTIVLIWSGGADSTMLLYELSLFCKIINKDLHVVHVSTPLIDIKKRSMETNAMDIAYDRIVSCHSRTRSKIILKELTVGGTEELFSSPRTLLALPQQTIWALYTSILAPEKTHIFFGYIEEDHFWHYKESFNNLIYWFNKCSGKDVVVDYPYEYVRKVEIIEGLLELGAYEDTWSCENVSGINKPCGNCRPCHENITALTELAMNGNTKAHDVLKSRYGKEL